MLARGGGGKDGAEETRQEEAKTTKREYNLWLVRQDNAKMAEQTRDDAKNGAEVIKERKRLHASQGLARQQAAMAQMKHATEALEAHRQHNLAQGRKLYEDLKKGEVVAKTYKTEWEEHGKAIRQHQKDNNFTSKAIEQSLADKKAQAAATRADDQAKQAERDRLRKEKEAEVQAQATAVREATSDKVIDESKTFAYQQRLTEAQSTKTQSAQLAKERAEKKKSFTESQTKRRNATKASVAKAGTARDQLTASRAAEAAALREKKKGLADAKTERLQQAYLERQQMVKSVIDAAIYHEGEGPTGGSPHGSPRLGMLSPKPLSPKSTPGTRGRGGSATGSGDGDAS